MYLADSDDLPHTALVTRPGHQAPWSGTFAMVAASPLRRAVAGPTSRSAVVMQITAALAIYAILAASTFALIKPLDLTSGQPGRAEYM